VANLTVTIDDDLLRAARVRAVQHGTSVNEVCRQAIAEFAGQSDDPQDWLRRLQAVAARQATPGTVGRRDDWYDEALDDRSSGRAR
jgi:plasmid stability protein